MLNETRRLHIAKYLPRQIGRTFRYKRISVSLLARGFIMYTFRVVSENDM